MTKIYDASRAYWRGDGLKRPNASQARRENERFKIAVEALKNIAFIPFETCAQKTARKALDKLGIKWRDDDGT